MSSATPAWSPMIVIRLESARDTISGYGVFTSAGSP
jgi:hypothetical protein